VIPFKDRMKQRLKERGVTLTQFCVETEINPQRFFYTHKHKHHRAYYMACAYYLGTTVEELVEGTDAEIDWYGDAGI